VIIICSKFYSCNISKRTERDLELYHHYSTVFWWCVLFLLLLCNRAPFGSYWYSHPSDAACVACKWTHILFYMQSVVVKLCKYYKNGAHISGSGVHCNHSSGSAFHEVHAVYKYAQKLSWNTVFKRYIQDQAVGWLIATVINLRGTFSGCWGHLNVMYLHFPIL
jgi:hypothetical protein